MHNRREFTYATFGFFMLSALSKCGGEVCLIQQTPLPAIGSYPPDIEVVEPFESIPNTGSLSASVYIPQNTEISEDIPIKQDNCDLFVYY